MLLRLRYCSFTAWIPRFSTCWSHLNSLIPLQDDQNSEMMGKVLKLADRERVRKGRLQPRTEGERGNDSCCTYGGNTRWGVKMERKEQVEERSDREQDWLCSLKCFRHYWNCTLFPNQAIWINIAGESDWGGRKSRAAGWWDWGRRKPGGGRTRGRMAVRVRFWRVDREMERITGFKSRTKGGEGQREEGGEHRLKPRWAKLKK